MPGTALGPFSAWVPVGPSHQPLLAYSPPVYCCPILLFTVPFCHLRASAQSSPARFATSETGWDLGPFAGTWAPLLLCRSACTWTHFSSNKIQRNCMGLKMHTCTVGANSGPKSYKETKNPTATFEEPGAKTGCREQKQGVRSKSRVLRMPPSHNTT